MQKGRGGGRGRGQELICVARADYACYMGRFPGCCVCVGAGGSRQMLQMKELLLCADLVGENSSLGQLISVWCEDILTAKNKQDVAHS